ncbi:MAG: Gfo/Idh/MocA family oxidoreductase [bacterium]|nr:Gfo/Idh/MocA family oxidoreductase [bacterium]
MKRLRCAVLGVADEGQELLSAVSGHRGLDLVAVGDSDHPSLRVAAERVRAEPFVDLRLLIVETGPEVIFVSSPAYQAADHLLTAAERGVGVFQLAPWATDFHSAAELVEAFERRSGAYVVARRWSAEPAYTGLRKIEDLLGRVHTIDLSVAGKRCDPETWRGNLRQAGGGALLHEAYEQIDLIISACGLPEQVYSASSWIVGPGEARPYDTEDAMTVVCRYPGDRVATFSSYRSDEPPGWEIALRGSKARAEVTPHRMRVEGQEGGRIVDRRVWRRSRYGGAVGAFVASWQDGAALFSSTARDHLPTMAVIQAAYLSAKTGEAESPGKFLELAGVR